MAQGRETGVSAEPSMQQSATRVVLVTGPSGAGRSTAIAALEDLGYETIDNLPLSLVPRLLDGPLARPLALGVDVRNRDFAVTSLIELIDGLTRFCSIREMVPLVTPARLASSRCDSPNLSLTMRKRAPTSMPDPS